MPPESDARRHGAQGHDRDDCASGEPDRAERGARRHHGAHARGIDGRPRRMKASLAASIHRVGALAYE